MEAVLCSSPCPFGRMIIVLISVVSSAMLRVALRERFSLLRRFDCDRLASQGRGSDRDLHDPRYQRGTTAADFAVETASGGFESSQPEKCRLGSSYYEPAWR
jgi:hypothetical protein